MTLYLACSYYDAGASDADLSRFAEILYHVLTSYGTYSRLAPGQYRTCASHHEDCAHPKAKCRYATAPPYPEEDLHKGPVIEYVAYMSDVTYHVDVTIRGFVALAGIAGLDFAEGGGKGEGEDEDRGRKREREDKEVARARKFMRRETERKKMELVEESKQSDGDGPVSEETKDPPKADRNAFGVLGWARAGLEGIFGL
ncbi:hypothetical protein BDW74DRAFT_179005 [Aspergillus multicolor]|uniref:uncharacterized protein n=1 Tax=Aspergillus multicolor TaxID=41759 RepID=UPI003CCD9F7A